MTVWVTAERDVSTCRARLAKYSAAYKLRRNSQSDAGIFRTGLSTVSSANTRTWSCQKRLADAAATPRTRPVSMMAQKLEYTAQRIFLGEMRLWNHSDYRIWKIIDPLKTDLIFDVDLFVSLSSIIIIYNWRGKFWIHVFVYIWL